MNGSCRSAVANEIPLGEQQLWEYGREANAGEPVFVPNPDSEREEDGWVVLEVVE